MKSILLICLLTVCSYVLGDTTESNHNNHNAAEQRKNEITSTIDIGERQYLINAIVMMIKNNQQLERSSSFENAVKHCSELIMHEYMPCKVNNKLNSECAASREIVTNSLAMQILNSEEAPEIETVFSYEEYHEYNQYLGVVAPLTILVFFIVVVIMYFKAAYPNNDKRK